MDVSIIVATYGSEHWKDMALGCAVPAARSLWPHGGEREILVHHRPEATLAGARNEAAAGAGFDWLLFLDADDDLDYGYLQAMAAAWTEYRQWSSAFTLLVPAVAYWKPPSRPGALPTEIPSRIPDWHRWPELNCAVIGTLVPRPLFLEVGGFREDFPLYEDWELWLRCAQAGARLVPVPQAVYRARMGQGRNHQPAVAKRIYDLIRAEHEENFPAYADLREPMPA